MVSIVTLIFVGIVAVTLGVIAGIFLTYLAANESDPVRPRETPPVFLCQVDNKTGVHRGTRLYVQTPEGARPVSAFHTARYDGWDGVFFEYEA